MKIILRKIRSLITTILLYKVFRHWVLLNMISTKIRPKILKFCGAKIGNGVYFSNGIYIDNNAEYLEIEDDVVFSPNVTILFHKRNPRYFGKNKYVKNVPHIKSKVHIKKGASIGTGALILPGVTVGEGSIIGAGTLVNKNVPDWSVVSGNPMKIIKQYE